MHFILSKRSIFCSSLFSRKALVAACHPTLQVVHSKVASFDFYVLINVTAFLDIYGTSRYSRASGLPSLYSRRQTFLCV